MVKLNSVSISNFGAIGPNQSYVFDSAGIYTVLGRNLDAGGGNAAAKTTFIQAIVASITGLQPVGLTANDVKNRFDSSTKPTVRIELTTKVGTLVITRVIGSKTDVFLNDTQLMGKADELQKKIYEILGVNEQQFLHLAYKKQESWGGFLRLKDADKKEFLGSFFNMSELDPIRDKNESDLKLAIETKTKLNNQISNIQTQTTMLDTQSVELNEQLNALLSTENRIKYQDLQKYIQQSESEIEIKRSYVTSDDALFERIKELPELHQLIQQFTELNESLCVYTNDLQSLKELHNPRLSQIDTILLSGNKEIESLAVKSKELNQSIKKAYDLNAQKTKLENSLSQLLIEMQNIESKIAATSTSTCSECNQLLPHDHVVGKISQLELQKNQISNQISSTQNSLIGLKDVSPALILELNSQKDQIDKEISDKSNLDTQKAIFNEKQAILNQYKQHEDKIKDCQNKIEYTKDSMKRISKTEKDKINNDIKYLQSMINSNKDLVAAKDKELNSIKSQLDTIQKKLALHSNELGLITNEYALNEETLAIAEALSVVLSKSGFIGSVFDSILEELTEESNKNLQEMPVVSKYNIQFSSDKTAKTTGNSIKSISYTLLDSGSEASFQTLSGAEKTFVIVAVDEALDTILKRRLGIDIGFKILDEQFMYSDASNKEPILEFLEHHNPDRMYIIIDHSVEINSGHGQHITLTKENNIASIT